jgi:hypothetical protein
MKKQSLDSAISVFIFGRDLAIKAGMHKDCSLLAAHEREARRERVRFARLWKKAVLGKKFKHESALFLVRELLACRLLPAMRTGKSQRKTHKPKGRSPKEKEPHGH